MHPFQAYFPHLACPSRKVQPLPDFIFCLLPKPFWLVHLYFDTIKQAAYMQRIRFERVNFHGNQEASMLLLEKATQISDTHVGHLWLMREPVLFAWTSLLLFQCSTLQVLAALKEWECPFKGKNLKKKFVQKKWISNLAFFFQEELLVYHLSLNTQNLSTQPPIPQIRQNWCLPWYCVHLLFFQEGLTMNFLMGKKNHAVIGWPSVFSRCMEISHIVLN